MGFIDKVIKFKENLKPNDIIIDNDYYYRFIGFKKCNTKFKSCNKECQGDYILIDMKTNKEKLWIGCRAYEKVEFEEFITESEFSI